MRCSRCLDDADDDYMICEVCTEPVCLECVIHDVTLGGGFGTYCSRICRDIENGVKAI